MQIHHFSNKSAEANNLGWPLPPKGIGSIACAKVIILTGRNVQEKKRTFQISVFLNTVGWGKTFPIKKRNYTLWNMHKLKYTFALSIIDVLYLHNY